MLSRFFEVKFGRKWGIRFWPTLHSIGPYGVNKGKLFIVANVPIKDIYGKAIGRGQGMRKFVEYIGVLVLFFVLVNSIDGTNRYMSVLMHRNFHYAALGSLVQIIGSFLFGLFLGSFDFIPKLKNDGNWKVNKGRLLALGLPLLIILVMGNITILGIRWPQMIYNLMIYILTSDSMIKYIAIFLGYIVISSFDKKSESIISIKVNPR